MALLELGQPVTDQLTPEQHQRWNRAIDLVSLAAGEDNDCEAAELALKAVEGEDLRGLLAAAVGVAAATADILSRATGHDVHDLLWDMR